MRHAFRLALHHSQEIDLAVNADGCNPPLTSLRSTYESFFPPPW